MSERIKIEINVTAGAWLDRLLEAVETIGRMANGGAVRQPIDTEADEADEADRRKILDLKGTESITEFVSSFNGLVCAECGQPQFTSPGGITCANGHGGANGVAPEKSDATLGQSIENNVAGNDQTAGAGNDQTAGAGEQSPPPPPPAGVELADGIPHDPRIHASTRTKLKTEPFGWKMKRGVDPVLVASVTAELRAAMLIPAGGQQLPAADAGQQQPPATDAVTAFGTIQQPPAADPTDTAPPAIITTFGELVNAITPALTGGTLTQATIDAALAEVGLQSVQLLGARPDLVPMVAAKLFPGV